MRWFDDSKIKTKLLIGFFIAPILTVLLASFSIYQLKLVNTATSTLQSQILPACSTASQITNAMAEFRIAELHHILSTVNEDKHKYETRMDDAMSKFSKNQLIYESLTPSAEEKVKYQAFKQECRSYFSDQLALISLSREGKEAEAKEIIRTKPDLSRRNANALIADILALNEKAAIDISHNADLIYKSSVNWILGALVLVILLGIVVAYWLAGKISRPLNETVQLANQLADGDLAIAIAVKSKDETGQLSAAMSKMLSYLREMAAVAGAIAGGNLAHQVQPKSPKDIFGNEFKKMLSNLRFMAEVADSIAKGDLSIHVEPQSSADAFGNTFKKMTDNLRSMASVADAIAIGNLTIRVEPQSPADVFGNAFKKMSDSLRVIIREVGEGAQNLSTASNKLVAIASQQTSSIQDQASSIQEISTTLDEIKAIVEQSSERAKSVVSITEQSLDISKSGQQELEQVVVAMSKIREQVEVIAENIIDLNEKTIQIGEITSSVNDLAEQSNLLAVNAAIEATKAGEAGKGFGVVAVEVKNLASRSKKATAQVRLILADIQKAANSTVMVTEAGNKKVESGVAQIYRIGTNIKSLHDVIVESSSAVRQIASSSNQQVTGIEQIVLAMKNINQGTHETVASAKEQNLNAQHLSQMATNLNNIVQRYRI